MNKPKYTATQLVRTVLGVHEGKWLAVHEIGSFAKEQGDYVSENSIASRLCIDLKGEVISRYREGKRFKEWTLGTEKKEDIWSWLKKVFVKS